MIRTVTTVVDIAWTDGETSYDDRYEVSGLVEREDGGNGWSDQYTVIGELLISAPDGDVLTSRAIPDFLPSNWIDEAASALCEQAGQDFVNGESDGPDTGDFAHESWEE